MKQEHKNFLDPVRLQSRIIQNQEKQIHNLERMNEILKQENADLRALCDRQQELLEALVGPEDTDG